MFSYKGFTIWYNEMRHKWLLQSGYEILGEYSTIGAAKAAATRLSNKY